jgi:hypothetical protein
VRASFASPTTSLAKTSCVSGIPMCHQYSVSLCKVDDSHTAVCVRILLHACPYTTKYVSSCYYVCPDVVSVWQHGFKMYESSTCTFWHQKQLFLSVWKHDDSNCMKEILAFILLFFSCDMMMMRVYTRPHGFTSNNSAWELEGLKSELTERRG